MIVAYDVELRRPGCAIVQAAMGGSLGIANAFRAESWLTAPTDGMRLYRVTAEQLARLVLLTDRA